MKCSRTDVPGMIDVRRQIGNFLRKTGIVLGNIDVPGQIGNAPRPTENVASGLNMSPDNRKCHRDGAKFS